MTNNMPPGRLGKELLGKSRFNFRGKPREAYASSVASSASTAATRLVIAMVVWRARG